MSTGVNLLAKIGKLPLGYEFTPAAYRPLLLQRLELYLSGSSGILLGTSDTITIPTRNIGATFRPSTSSWWAWDDTLAEYIPVAIGLINGNFGTTINAAPSANRTLTLPNATGTALLLTDISVPKEVVVLTSTSGTVSTIDANVSNNFILTLTENSTIPSLTNMASGSGKKIRIAIINDGTSFTVTWPTSGANEIKWPASPSHTQPVASAGQPRASAIYTITEANIGQTYHLWGDPEVAGFNQVGDIDTGGTEHIDPTYGGEEVPPPKGIRPYDRP